MIKYLASRITTLTDARYFAAKEVQFLSFRFEEKAEGYLDPMIFKAIRAWVEMEAFLGEFDLFSAQMVRETVDFLQLDGVVLGKNFPKTEVEQLQDLRIFRVILDHDLQKMTAQLLSEQSMVEAFILEADGISTEILTEICGRFSIFLKSTMPAQPLFEMLKIVQPSGLIFTGSEEDQVGLRSFEDMEDVFDALEKLD